MNSPLPSAISVAGLSYSYRSGKAPGVLKDLSFELDPGTYALLCGASGSGKSTLCRTFNGLIPHFYGGRITGRVSVEGRRVADLRVCDLFDRVGMVFQNPDAQLFNRTVSAEIAFGLESLGLPSRDIRVRMGRAAKTMGITPLMGRAPARLSGGEKQLVALAAVLALNPSVVVLDEPYANLDPINVRRVRRAVSDIHRSGTGVVVCEHRMGYTLPDAQRVLVLEKGRLAADAAPGTIARMDLERLGLRLPLPVLAGRLAGQDPLPMTADEVAVADLPRGAVEALLPKPLDSPAGGAGPLLEVDGLSCKVNGSILLENIRFSLEPGETLAIVGANGAGKTTLIRHLNGLLRPAAGSIRLKGSGVTGRPVAELARHIGIAFQNPESQFFRFSVREEIAAGPEALGCLDPAHIEALGRTFRLTKLMDRAPFRLSGGEKKRVAFASALAAQPDILILDEPTAGQDHHFRKALEDELERLRGRGASIILVTHDLSFAEANAHRWLVLAKGSVQAYGPPESVMGDSRAMAEASLEPTPAFCLKRRLKMESRHA
ncbi:MAG: ABC transporter ATP-binding protein [Desulfobacterales bacterium]